MQHFQKQCNKSHPQLKQQIASSQTKKGPVEEKQCQMSSKSYTAVEISVGQRLFPAILKNSINCYRVHKEKGDQLDSKINPLRNFIQHGVLKNDIAANHGIQTNKNDKNYSETWRVPDGLTPKEIKRELERETLRFTDEVAKNYNKYTSFTPKQKETLIGYAKKWLRRIKKMH